MVRINIPFDQLKKAIQKLPIKDRARLVEELERQTRKNQFQQILARIDARLKKNPISQKEINQIVEEAREEYHVRSRR